MNFKLNKFNMFLIKYPTAIAGFALAIASLGLCWDNVAQVEGAVQTFTAVLASALLFPLLLKFIFNPSLLLADLKHHLAGSMLPVIAMAMMVIASSITPFSFNIAFYFSVVAIILHLFLLISFVYYRAINFKLSQLLPSWFIPPIGLVLALLVFPGGLAIPIAKTIFYFSLLSYLLLLPIVLYRLHRADSLMVNEQPTLVILATPASLLLAAYFLMPLATPHFIFFMLLTVALIMTLSAYFCLFTLLRLPFTPIYSAFTFPLVVGAIALFKMIPFVSEFKGSASFLVGIEWLAYIELWGATLMVVYVMVRYCLYFFAVKRP